MRTLEVVVGAQFGSEAKGHVVQRLTEKAVRDGRRPQVLRVAGPNAGHTGHDRTGRAWALRQVPVAAVVDGPVSLGITAGSEIDLPVLLSEIDALEEAGLLDRKILWVHGEATMIYDRHKETENMPDFDAGGRPVEGTNLVGRIGSTGKGIGAARADRLMRTGLRLIDDEDAVRALNDRGVPVAGGDHDAGGVQHQHVIVEGTQGFGLGLRAGFYPQCTSSDCRAQDFVAMAGLAPWAFDDVKVWAVARIFPIRVAGNSGPLRNETTWEALGLEPEYTTVTKKMRRVGMPDWELVRRAVAANGGAPTVRLAVTMVDQVAPALANKTWEDMAYMAPEVMQFKLPEYLVDVERQVQARVAMITTGPNTGSFIDLGDLR